MLTYQYVEDYLELLGGYDPNTLSGLIFPNNSKKISLARYDIQIVESMSASTIMGTALTDKQAELAVKLILKYRRQFANCGVDVRPCETPVYRMPPRKIDRSKLIYLDNDRIVVKFPYDSVMIKELQSYKNESQGYTKFDREDKVWYLGLTEQNVNWAVAWGKAMGFAIDPQVEAIFDLVIAAEQQSYEIKLIKNSIGYEVTNAAPSLIEYINKHVGGFGLDNLVNLIDHSGVLEYDIDDAVIDQCLSEYPAALVILGMQHNTHLVPSPENLNMIFDYAEITDRYPVCIYNPTLFDMDLSRFKEEDIVYFDRNGKTKTSDYDPYRVKVVYAHKIPTTWNFPVPLMVTTFEMMYGGKRMDWTQRAEKIIHYSATKIKDED